LIAYYFYENGICGCRFFSPAYSDMASFQSFFVNSHRNLCALSQLAIHRQVDTLISHLSALPNKTMESNMNTNHTATNQTRVVKVASFFTATVITAAIIFTNSSIANQEVAKAQQSVNSAINTTTATESIVVTATRLVKTTTRIATTNASTAM
jgi:hypothetical protein